MDGILIINKPKNYTSNDIVNKVKKALNTKVGHTGTLDPNATGVLPLLLGKGTKFSKYLINHDKKYIATLQLGIKTSTADVEGDVIEEKEVDTSVLESKNINNVLKSFIGKQVQTPPIYSAIKVKGKKLYEYARNNIDVEIPKRNIEIYSINLIDMNPEKNELKFEVECSKGTYIRSLCEDIAENLNTVGYMKELQRAKAGEFEISQSITMEELSENKNNIDWLNKKIITLEDLLKNTDKIIIKSCDFDKFLNGVKLTTNNKDGLYAIYTEDNKFIGSGIVENKKVKRDVILY
ncbi:MAG: tRNA pseudouridine(55) synthase TruB [Clostridia bacterium]|nr:tRNA pseudouridine(55) synthase TruB [Clostridia bacterium]